MNDLIITSPDQSVTITAGGPSLVSIIDTEPTIEIDTGGLPGPPGLQGPQGEVGPQGPKGDDAEWVRMTQAQYDALIEKDSQTLYVIIG